jgi:hypothetical protein
VTEATIRKLAEKPFPFLETLSGRSGGMRGNGAAAGGFVWFLGFIGAAIYYVQTASGFWMGALGILKAIVWPAFLVYTLLSFAHA